MADVAIFKINYKSDFVLTINSDAGWAIPFCIKFWTASPSQAYFVGFDGTNYKNCRAGETASELVVLFDDHHLPIGNLKMQIAYHATIEEFPKAIVDEVTNATPVITDIDGVENQVMLDFTGETSPELEFDLPAYANEAQRIANEQQRIANEEQRIANEEQRIQNEQQRIRQEQERMQEFNQIKHDLDGAADDANYAATLANEKAALAQQKAEYAKAQGDYAKEQGNYAKEQGDVALADHLRAEEDHGIAVDDHTQAGTDHTRAESDHGIAVDDHTQAGSDHTRAESDHGIAVDDHTQAGTDHQTAQSDHTIAANDHTQAGNDHTRAESDHGIAVDDHTQAGTDHQTAQSDHTIAGNDHTQAGSDHTRAESDHTRAEADHAAVEVYVDSLGAFDISAYHATGGVLAKYTDLAAALGTNGANIPDALRKGGMSVKFVQSSDNKYVQYRLMSDTFNTTVANWQGVDDEPTANSDNLVKSGGVHSAINEVDDKIEGATVEVEVDYEGTYEHQYFASEVPHLIAYYLASSKVSLVAFPITKDKKYRIDIPKSPNGFPKVAVYSNILPVNGQATPLYDSSSSAIVIPTEQGDANPMIINIAAAEDYSYIIVCYQTNGGVPTCITETTTQGIKEEIGNLNELTTTDKTSLVGAINEVKATPSITIDDTLSIEGEAADAKAVGVAFNGTTSKTDVISTDIYANEYFGSSPTPNIVIVKYSTTINCSIIVYPLIYGGKYELHIPKTQIGAKVWTYLNEQPIAGQQKRCEGRFVDDTMGDFESMDLVINSALDYKYLAVCYIPNSGVPTLKRIETNGGVYSKIGNLEVLQTENNSNLVAAINEAANTPIEICLPDKIYAVVGDTLQLFLRSVVKAVNPYNYSIKITCNKGQQFSRYFEYTPIAGDVGTTDFTVTVRNNNGVLLGSKTCSLVTAATPTSPSNQINIASFGASISAPGKWQEEACRRLIGSGGTPSGHGLNNIAFVGKMTQDGWLAHWCGYGGWTWGSYTSAGLKCFRFIIPSFTSLEIGAVYTNNGYQYTVAEVNPDGDMLFTTSSFDNVPEASGILTKVSGNGDATLTFTSATKESTNPLWDADNNKMSFIPYANQYCNGQIDVVMTQLGWNGMLSAYQTDFSSVESKVKQFADCLHTEFPNAKLKILGLTLPSQNGACGSTYALTIPYSDTYGLTVNAINLNKLYQQIANEAGYSDFVEYVPVAQQFDAENSYPVNVRLKNNRLIIKPFAADGYYKIGDIVKHENNFYVCINQGVVGQWENVYQAYLPYDPYERYDWNAVHPSDGGYNQMADAVYRNIVANYCQGI